MPIKFPYTPDFSTTELPEAYARIKSSQSFWDEGKAEIYVQAFESEAAYLAGKNAIFSEVAEISGETFDILFNQVQQENPLLTPKQKALATFQAFLLTLPKYAAGIVIGIALTLLLMSNHDIQGAILAFLP